MLRRFSRKTAQNRKNQKQYFSTKVGLTQDWSGWRADLKDLTRPTSSQRYVPKFLSLMCLFIVVISLAKRRCSIYPTCSKGTTRQFMPDISPELLALGFIWYVAFLFSTTCHEAAHALAAKLGGDETAFVGGQVALNPVPHIQREPWGMVIIPILSLIINRSIIGWASAPYDALWERRHPRRAAWMALAGPADKLLAHARRRYRPPPRLVHGLAARGSSHGPSGLWQ